MRRDAKIMSASHPYSCAWLWHPTPWSGGAIHLRAYEGKKVRISGVLESPHVIVVLTIDEVD